jgi:hypothetical protein
MEKINCWEYKECGRESGGVNAEQLGICPASTETRLNGVHGGVNAGRTCWVVTGSLCEDEVQGTFSDKYKNCFLCDFHIKVKREEDSNYQLTSSLLLKLRPS